MATDAYTRETFLKRAGVAGAAVLGGSVWVISPLGHRHHHHRHGHRAR